MKTRSVIFTFLIQALILFSVFGQESIGFDEAKALSKEQNKPILLEFVRSD